MYLDILFEELPLFREGSWIAGRAEVTATVAVSLDGDWHVTELAIAADNGKTGPDAEGKLVEVAKSDPMWGRLVNEIESHHQHSIGEKITEARAEDDDSDRKWDERKALAEVE
jgi:hypothetical protein